MHHLDFVISIQTDSSEKIFINHEFGSDVMKLSETKRVQLLLLMRKYIYHFLLLPVQNKQPQKQTYQTLQDFIELEITGSLDLNENQYVVNTRIGQQILQLPNSSQAKIYAAVVMYLDQAGVMFVRHGQHMNQRQQ